MLVMAAIALLAAFMVYQTPGYGTEKKVMKAPLQKFEVPEGLTEKTSVELGGYVGDIYAFEGAEDNYFGAVITVLHADDKAFKNPVVVLITTEHEIQTLIETAYLKGRAILSRCHETTSPPGWDIPEGPTIIPPFYEIEFIGTAEM
jgi:hypothetical protein